MEEVQRVLSTGEYLKMTDEELEQVARREFCKFEDDQLKIKFLSILFSRRGPEDISMSPEECARLIVESGTFEGGQ